MCFTIFRFVRFNVHHRPTYCASIQSIPISFTLSKGDLPKSVHRRNNVLQLRVPRGCLQQLSPAWAIHLERLSPKCQEKRGARKIRMHGTRNFIWGVLKRFSIWWKNRRILNRDNSSRCKNSVHKCIIFPQLKRISSILWLPQNNNICDGRFWMVKGRKQSFAICITETFWKMGPPRPFSFIFGLSKQYTFYNKLM